MIHVGATDAAPGSMTPTPPVGLATNHSPLESAVTANVGFDDEAAWIETRSMIVWCVTAGRSVSTSAYARGTTIADSLAPLTAYAAVVSIAVAPPSAPRGSPL